MIVLLKIAAATGIALSMLSPGFGPKADSCQCKADAGAVGSMVPRADDCSCKANANAIKMVPHAEDCQCKAKA